jgi:hypothetical protein
MECGKWHTSPLTFTPIELSSYHLILGSETHSTNTKQGKEKNTFSLAQDQGKISEGGKWKFADGWGQH